MKLNAMVKLTHFYQGIAAFIGKNGYAPTVREMMPMLPTTSTSVVEYNLNKLAAMRWINRPSNTSRAIQLLKPLADLPDVSELTVVEPPVTTCCVEGCERPVWDGPRGMHFALRTCYLHTMRDWAKDSNERHGVNLAVMEVRVVK